MTPRPLWIALVALALGSCGISDVGEPEASYNVHYSGLITVDGVPVDAGRVHLSVEVLLSEGASLQRLSSEQVSGSNGSYDAKADINTALCDNLWLVVESSDPAGEYAHYLQAGCGDHALDLSVTTNLVLSGTVSLDGVPVQWTGSLYLVLDPTPPDLRTRLVPVSTLDGGLHANYSTSHRIDPRLCDDLWIWLDMPGVTSPMAKVPGCGTHVVDVNLTS